MGLRFLVVEGNTRTARERHAADHGLTPSGSYAAVLQAIEPAAVCDLAFPADEGANLPDPAGLEGYDAVVLTGSALNLYEATPPILRQIELMRAVYASRTPAFGSCWGVQVGAAAAGGDVRRNPAGLEVGFARGIAPTDEGLGHPMLAGRPRAFTAPAVHLDAVTTPPPDCTVLAQNALAPIQAAEIRHAGGVFWGVQYHPEFDLLELGAILDRYDGPLVEAGLCRDAGEVRAYAADLKALHRDPSRTDLAWRHGLDAEVTDPERRTREIRNFIEHRVKPEKSLRGRA
ncbi:MAG TPA: type 1 glutamine amidotransferase [Beijerinckiaceae bacterium]|jgi:GMP synthase (glutamine-hydrolysing)